MTVHIDKSCKNKTFGLKTKTLNLKIFDLKTKTLGLKTKTFKNEHECTRDQDLGLEDKTVKKYLVLFYPE